MTGSNNPKIRTRIPIQLQYEKPIRSSNGEWWVAGAIFAIFVATAITVYISNH